MEGLTKRTYAVAGLMMLVGVAVLASPKFAEANPKSEDWLIKTAPTQIGPYHYVENPRTPGVSYKMDESTYSTLNPWGIVAREFENGPKKFDVVLISSNRKTSFHDPRVCFRAQGWIFKSEQQDSVDTSRGVIPMTFVEMNDPQEKPQIAAFFYKDLHHFYSTPQALALDMFWSRFRGEAEIQGVFYRFIPLYDGATESDLKDFIRLYMDEAKKASNGFF